MLQLCHCNALGPQSAVVWAGTGGAQARDLSTQRQPRQSPQSGFLVHGTSGEAASTPDTAAALPRARSAPGRNCLRRAKERFSLPSQNPPPPAPATSTALAEKYWRRRGRYFGHPVFQNWAFSGADTPNGVCLNSARPMLGWLDNTTKSCFGFETATRWAPRRQSPGPGQTEPRPGTPARNASNGSRHSLAPSCAGPSARLRQRQPQLRLGSGREAHRAPAQQ